MKCRLVFYCLLIHCGGAVQGQAPLPYTGTVVIQDFDSLPSSGQITVASKGPFELNAAPFDAVGMAGWQLFANVGSTVRWDLSEGTFSTAGTASYGMIGDGDRALGAIASGGYKCRWGVLLRNDTGQTLTELTTSFVAEQWRYSGGATPNQVTASYRIANTLPALDSTAGLTVAPTLSFVSPVVSGTAGMRNGNLPVNRVRVSATISGISWPSGQFLMLRWQDEDDAGSPDDALAMDDFAFFAPTSVALAPELRVPLASPAHRVSPTWRFPLRFTRPVNGVPAAVSLAGSVSGPLAFTVEGGPIDFEVVPAIPLPAGEVITCSVDLSQITSRTGGLAGVGGVVSGVATTLPDPATAVVAIHEVQGAGQVSPVIGATVTVEGVVTGSFQGGYPALGGYWLQEEDADADGVVETSEAVWVHDGSVPVAVGDVVRVTGQVEEYEGLTEMEGVSAVQALGTATLPAPVAVTLPMVSSVGLERFEGMRVLFGQALTVTNNEELGRQGELTLSSAGRIWSPTEKVDPNDDPVSGVSSSGSSQVAAVRARQRANALDQLILDDGSIAFYPDPTPFLNAQQTRRCGDTVTGLAGFLSQSVSGYRLIPEVAVTFANANPRPVSPAARSGRLRIASMNVLNYFITLNERGANSASELARQKEKVIAALVALDADVLGLIEIERNAAAVQDLLSGLNAALPAQATPYTVLPDPAAGPGADAIRLVWLYRADRLQPVGASVTDSDGVWNTPDPLRPPLIQLFEEGATGERFFVCLNHFKSKGSAPTSQAQQVNFDQGDGQAAWNRLRVEQAQRLAAVLAAAQTARGDHDVLILGDLNAYGEEDPLDALRALGYADQSARFDADGASYRRQGELGRLDHAFATGTLAAQIVNVSHWGINADEPPYFDYNEETKSAAQLAVNVGTPYRSSDHDPVVVDVNLSPQPIDYGMWVAQREWPAPGADLVNSDPDLDGMSNLEEFVLNHDPLQPDPAGISGERDGLIWRLDFPLRKRLQGVTVVPQWSPDLVQWYPMSAVGRIGDFDFQTDWMEAEEPLGLGTIRFGRLRVTQP